MIHAFRGHTSLVSVRVFHFPLNLILGCDILLKAYPAKMLCCCDGEQKKSKTLKRHKISIYKTLHALCWLISPELSVKMKN